MNRDLQTLPFCIGHDHHHGNPFHTLKLAFVAHRRPSASSRLDSALGRWAGREARVHWFFQWGCRVGWISIWSPHCVPQSTVFVYAKWLHLFKAFDPWQASQEILLWEASTCLWTRGQSCEGQGLAALDRQDIPGVNCWGLGVNPGGSWCQCQVTFFIHVSSGISPFTAGNVAIVKALSGIPSDGGKTIPINIHKPCLIIALAHAAIGTPAW